MERVLGLRLRARVASAAAPPVDRWKQQLGRVLDSVWERTDLQTLIRADNGLSELSERVGRLEQLRILDLGHNRLTGVPDALGGRLARDGSSTSMPCIRPSSPLLLA